jgi:Protein of unknown function (DUF3551)
MRLLLFLLVICADIVWMETRAGAQNYPWCAQYGSMGGVNCGFATLQQCQATVTGMGGFCEVNTQYQPAPGWDRSTGSRRR